MCARYELSEEWIDEKILSVLDVMEKHYSGEYKTGEIFPGDTVPAIIETQGRIVPVPAVFGFPGIGGSGLLINARSETAASKKTFSESFANTRAVLPATGFYEWSRTPDKAKYFFTADGSPVMYLCGLYKLIERKYRFVILTREAQGTVTGIHDRMPVIIGEKDVRPYLCDRETAARLTSAEPPALSVRTA